ncbi:MAG: helix-turn-helix domain-containing protein [Nitrososphaerota archaeon]|nr:helix-turn-helix domain-containing protein [Nitrososphaerota archaeon]
MVKNDPKALGMRRKIAIQLLLEGKTQEEAAKTVGATQSGVSRCCTAYEKEGSLDALNAGKHTGRPAGLNEEQRKQLLEISLKGAVKTLNARCLFR